MRAGLRRRWWLVGPAMVALSVLACGTLWPADDDRALLDKLVKQGKQAIEQRAPSQFIDCFAENYRDDSGMSRQDFYALAARVARDIPKTDVVIHDSSIQLALPKATGEFDVELIMHDGSHATSWPMKLEVQFVKKRQWPTMWKETWAVESIQGHGLDKSFVTM